MIRLFTTFAPYCIFLDAAAASHDVLEAEVKRISGVYASFFKDKKKKKRDERDDLLLP